MGQLLPAQGAGTLLEALSSVALQGQGVQTGQHNRDRCISGSTLGVPEPVKHSPGIGCRGNPLRIFRRFRAARHRCSNGHPAMPLSRVSLRRAAAWGQSQHGRSPAGGARHPNEPSTDRSGCRSVLDHPHRPETGFEVRQPRSVERQAIFLTQAVELVVGRWGRVLQENCELLKEPLESSR